MHTFIALKNNALFIASNIWEKKVENHWTESRRTCFNMKQKKAFSCFSKDIRQEI